MVIRIVSDVEAVRAENVRLTVVELHVLELRQITLLCVARALRAALFDNRKFLHLLFASETEIQSRDKGHDREKDR